MIIATFGFVFVFVQAGRGKIPWLVAVSFAINLFANLVFTPIQFGLRNLPLASLDILVVWGTILWLYDPLSDSRDPAAQSPGGLGKGAVLLRSLDRHGAATFDHVDESLMLPETARNGSTHFAESIFTLFTSVPTG